LNYDAFYQSVQRRKTAKNLDFEDLDLEDLDLEDLDLEDLDLEDIVRSKQEAGAQSQNLVILKDAENVKIAENQQ
jgi:hypothetical protein